MKKIRNLFCCIILLNNALFLFNASAQDSIPFYNMSLEQLMNVNVIVTTDQPMLARESPGIVTVITQDEIFKSGAHDLLQVLDMVPGFDFGVDVEGVVGIGVRGNWGHEGKVLLLWDGLELNEELFSTLQFGAHYPVAQIKKIEIIRGPGSAMYGGNAELAVINVITINNDLNGLMVDGQSAAYSNAISSRGTTICYGKKIKDVHFGFSTYQNRSNRSGNRYIDNFGNSYSMSNLSAINSQQYRVDFSLKKFSLIAFCDNYKILQRDGYDQVYSHAYRSKFFNSSINAKYEFFINKWKIQPGFRYKFEKPWNSEEQIVSDGFEPFNVLSSKTLYYINYFVSPSKAIDISGGFQYYSIVAQQELDQMLFNNGFNQIRTDSYGSFIQAIAKTKIVNLVLGSRFVHNSYFGNSFVPRVGITKIREKFHVKVLYSKGYRTPSIENVNLNDLIKPEYTSVIELEAGIKVGHQSYLTTNLYDISTKDQIVFFYDISNDRDDYKNVSKGGTRGVEVEYKWKSRKWFAALNYGFYTTAGHTLISEYSVPGYSSINLAFPSCKINFSANWKVNNSLSVSPSATFMSKRFSQVNTPVIHITEHPEVIYANINFSIENILFQRMTGQFSIMNIFNQDVYYIQPYNNNHAPLPGPGRQIQIRFNYQLSNR